MVPLPVFLCLSVLGHALGPHARVPASTRAISGKKVRKCAMGGRGFGMYKALGGAQGFMHHMNAVHI